jgi:ethanolamine utilization protein EutA
VAAAHQQVALRMPESVDDVAITLSGGVGQLVYRHAQTGTWPATTAFGDLGIDLARRLAESPFWRPHLARFVPTALGRATVYGLLRHSTQVSGSTVYLRDPACLPLSDLILLGTLTPASSPADIERLVGLALRTNSGGCLRIEWDGDPRPPVRDLAERIGQALSRQAAPVGVPLVFLMRENLGKVFGQYLTGWGTLPGRVVVIDEIDPRDVQFAHIGAAGENVIPVSFYGMN